MREIKFKAWDKHRKQMGEVSFIKFSKSQYVQVSVRFKENEKNIDEWYAYGQEDGSDNIKLMQYTGLKDKNGKEIYEGDIVKAKEPYKLNSKERFYTCEVVFTDGALFMLKHKTVKWGKEEVHYYNMRIMEIEVIGNIYENPELLEVN